MKISVIITCYNYEQYISEAIDSFLKQDCINKELIVVDDCSVDNSSDIIISYGDVLTPVLKNINQGHGAAFNSGFEKATGDLIMFLDADDYLLSGSLQEAVNNYQKGVSLYQYRTILVDEGRKDFGIFPVRTQSWNTECAKKNVLRYGRYQTSVTSGMVYNRSFLEKVLPMNEEDFRQGGDGYLAILAPLYGSIQSFEHLLSGYRQHGSNHSGFSLDVLKQAKWRISHDLYRYKYLKDHAKKNGEPFRDSYEDYDIYHLESRMCVALFDSGNSRKRFRLVLKALASLKMIKGFKYKMKLGVWWFFLLLPVRTARKIYLWKTVPASRLWRLKK